MRHGQGVTTPGNGPGRFSIASYIRVSVRGMRMDPAPASVETARGAKLWSCDAKGFHVWFGSGFLFFYFRQTLSLSRLFNSPILGEAEGGGVASYT